MNQLQAPSHWLSDLIEVCRKKGGAQASQINFIIKGIKAHPEGEPLLRHLDLRLAIADGLAAAAGRHHEMQKDPALSVASPAREAERVILNRIGVGEPQ
ncbi:MAG TPA: hypothetical protein VGX78_07115 [Pirellulales bacterium]|jgi:hypothetical protein|nr:hypothetical protein [Pirellulales bacterium]